MEAIFYSHHAVQGPQLNLRGSWKEDKLPIRLKFYKSSKWRHRVRSDPVVFEGCTKLAERDIWVKFSHFKQHLSNNYDSNREYGALITRYLSSMGVPQDEHPAIVHKLFRVVEAAVNPEIPVIVCVFHNTHRVVGGDGDGHGHEPCMPN